MADLTANAPLRIRGEARTEKWGLDSSASYTIYKGQPMVIDQGVDTVYARGWVDSALDNTDIFLGIAAESKAVVSGDPETNQIEMYIWPTVIGFKSAVFTDADVGDPVYMSDSATLSATIGDNPCIGKLERVEDGYAYVQLITPYICSGA